jgi:hypothetical protein
MTMTTLLIENYLISLNYIIFNRIGVFDKDYDMKVCYAN